MATAGCFPESSLAASYYVFYQENKQYEPKKGKDYVASRGDDDTHQSPDNRDASAAAVIDNEQAFWVSDEWTCEDERRAQQLLEKHHDRCRIRAPSNYCNNDGSNVENVHAWNQFYSQHQTNFFKDRYYLATAFPNELGQAGFGRNDASDDSSSSPCLVEVGCGVGNAMLPLLEEKHQSSLKKWKVYGLDLSTVAIDLLQKDDRFVAASKEGRAFCCAYDISRTDPPLPTNFVGVGTVTSLLFCLSAIDPHEHDRHRIAVHNAVSTMQPGGVLVFRDYGRYDQAQLQLGSQRKKLLGDNFYRKHDGTKCYYFTLEDLERLFVKEAGMEVLELQYIKRVYKNRSTDATRRRVWVQARFRKPLV